MAFEAITLIREAEEQAKRSRAQVIADARANEALAETDGKSLVSDAGKKARAEVREARAKSDAAATAAAEKLNVETENNKSAMLMHAERQFDNAASLIVERIVNV